jgi:prevent-host-death family protein
MVILAGMSEEEIGAAKFKEQCLSLLDNLGPDGIVITKHGKPVARLLPIATEWSEEIGAFADRIKIKGDILSTGARWDAES